MQVWGSKQRIPYLAFHTLILLHNVLCVFCGFTWHRFLYTSLFHVKYTLVSNPAFIFSNEYLSLLQFASKLDAWSKNKNVLLGVVLYLLLSSSLPRPKNPHFLLLDATFRCMARKVISANSTFYSYLTE